MYIVIEVADQEINMTTGFVTLEEAQEEMKTLYDDAGDCHAGELFEYEAYKINAGPNMARYDWKIEEINPWEVYTSSLPKEPDENNNVWFDGYEILTTSEEMQEHVYSVLRLVCQETIVTGFYDPDEDERNGEVDGYTGLYYVTTE